MPLDFDPVFHTETMVKILRDQGSTQYAMELAELILRQDPQHEGVRRILEELREEARRAFERFKSAGRPADTAGESDTASEGESDTASPEPEEQGPHAFESAVSGLGTEIELADEAVPEPAAQAPAAEPVRLTLVPSPSPPSRRAAKIRRLETLLRRVQSLRKVADAPQA